MAIHYILCTQVLRATEQIDKTNVISNISSYYRYNRTMNTIDSTSSMKISITSCYRLNTSVDIGTDIGR